MKFIVRFATSNRVNNIIYMDPSGIGTTFVDDVRTDLLLPNLALDLIGNTAPVLKIATKDVEIDEAAAKTLGIFDDVNLFTVYVPNKFLNTYVTIGYDVIRDSDNTVTAINPIYKISWPDVITAWVVAGKLSIWDA